MTASTAWRPAPTTTSPSRWTWTSWSPCAGCGARGDDPGGALRPGAGRTAGGDLPALPLRLPRVRGLVAAPARAPGHGPLRLRQRRRLPAPPAARAGGVLAGDAVLHRAGLGDVP